MGCALKVCEVECMKAMLSQVFMEYMSLRTHEDSEGLESLSLPAEVPQFLLLGNQSSGKTTILQRMTKLPLGVTGTTQGTCRPFQFTLIYDPSEDGHVIHVDGEEVVREHLLEKLGAKTPKMEDALTPDASVSPFGPSMSLPSSSWTCLG